MEDSRLNLLSLSDDNGRDFELAAAERVKEGVDHAWIEVGARSLGDDVAGFEERHRLAIRTIAREGIVDVGDRDDPRLERDVFAAGRVISRTRRTCRGARARSE